MTVVVFPMNLRTQKRIAATSWLLIAGTAVVLAFAHGWRRRDWMELGVIVVARIVGLLNFKSRGG